jgi:prevent-host-death family protein
VTGGIVLGTKVVTADEARKNFAELLNSATYGNERIQIERRGKVAGYIIGPKDMALLEGTRGKPSVGGGRAFVRPESAPIEEAIPVEEEETISWDELKESL